MDEGGEQSAVRRACDASLAWLGSMQAAGEPAGVLRLSAAHDPAQWPGVLLPGTCCGILCGELLQATLPQDGILAAWLLKHRRADGVFRGAGLAHARRLRGPDPEEAGQMADLRMTNAALAAMEAIDPGHRPVLAFAEPWMHTPTLKGWLADRDLRDPLRAGGAIADVGGLLLSMQRFDDAPAGPALHILFNWLERLQEPATGFWGIGQHASERTALDAMTGTAQLLHLWSAVGRPVPNQSHCVDHALTHSPSPRAASTDLALVDLLTQAHATLDHRRADIEAWLRDMLAGLLASQSADGGFADQRDGVWQQDSWLGEYQEAQGQSNTVATFLRWTAIGMIADTIWPRWRGWRFRRVTGFGYRRPRPAA